MSFEDIVQLICEETLFDKLTSYVGNACFDPGEWGEVG